MKLKNFLILGTLLILSACSANDDEDAHNYEVEEVLEVEGSVMDFFATAPNRTFVVESTPEMPFHISQETFNMVHIEGENLIQQKISSMGISSTIIVLYEEGVLRQTYSNFTLSPFIDLRDSDANAGIAILVEPLELGTGWQTPDGTASEITAIGREVITPYGTFTDTLEITRTFPEGIVVTSVFARGYGVVWESFPTTIGEEDIYVVRHLTNVIDGPLTETLEVFDNDFNVIETVQLSINTNENFEALFSNALGIIVNDITIDRETEILQVDLGEETDNLLGVLATFINFYEIDTQISINGTIIELDIFDED